MQRWRGKVAVVTGASSGIGLAIAKALVYQGLTVVGLARRLNKMLHEMRGIGGPGKFFAHKCDISKDEDVENTFKHIKESFKTIHILVNDAGIVRTKTVEEADIKEMQEVINTNFVGLVHCSKQAIKLMKANNTEGHIININSAAGHRVPNITFPNGSKLNGNVYSPTKYAVTSFSEVLANELLGGKIRVTSVSPGSVNTNLLVGQVDENLLNALPSLNPQDIADAVVYILGTPQHVQVTELTIRPLGEVF